MSIDINAEFNNIGEKLKTEDWSMAIYICDRLISAGYNMVEVYQARLLAEAKVKSFLQLASSEILLEKCTSYGIVTQKSSIEIKRYVEKCNTEIKGKLVAQETKVNSLDFLKIDFKSSESRDVDSTNTVHDEYIKKAYNESDALDLSTVIVVDAVKEKSKRSAFNAAMDNKKNMRTSAGKRGHMLVVSLLVVLIILIPLIGGTISRNRKNTEISEKIESNERTVEKNESEIERINERKQVYDAFASAYTQYRQGKGSESILEYYARDVSDTFDIDEGALLIYQEDYETFDRRARQAVLDELEKSRELIEENMKINAENMELKGY